jgi:hypothetical protein
LFLCGSSSERYGEAFGGRTTRLGFKVSYNQREYWEAYEVLLKAFGNWRAKFKVEPQTPARKVLYRRDGLSHTLSHDLSIGPIIPTPALELAANERQAIIHVQEMDAYGKLVDAISGRGSQCHDKDWTEKAARALLRTAFSGDCR